MNGNIGGPLRYDLLANIHRPLDPRQIAAEVRRLVASGMSDGDVAAALRLDIQQVRRMVGCGDCE